MDRFERQEESKSSRANIRARNIDYEKERPGEKKEQKGRPSKEKDYDDRLQRKQENSIRQAIYEESVANIKAMCTRHKIGYALHSALMGKNYVTWDGQQLQFNVYNRDDCAPQRGVHMIELVEIDEERFLISCSLLALEDGQARILIEPKYMIYGRFGAVQLEARNEIETLQHFLFTHPPNGNGRASLVEQTEEALEKLWRERDVTEWRQVRDLERKRGGGT